MERTGDGTSYNTVFVALPKLANANFTNTATVNCNGSAGEGSHPWPA